MPEAEAADKLLAGLRELLHMPDAEEALLAALLQAMFEAEGCHALFGKTQGYYGPYIWRDTVPTVYQVELPDGTAAYTVNILKGFVFRSWMDYLTFGRYGTGGWASPDGTINCIEQAYDFAGERYGAWATGCRFKLCLTSFYTAFNGSFYHGDIHDRKNRFFRRYPYARKSDAEELCQGLQAAGDTGRGPAPAGLDDSVRLLVSSPADYSFPSGHTLSSIPATFWPAPCWAWPSALRRIASGCAAAETSKGLPRGSDSPEGVLSYCLTAP